MYRISVSAATRPILLGLTLALAAGQAFAQCRGGAVPGSREECPYSTPAPECDYECRESNRSAARNYRAWKENHLGAEALRRNQFDKARVHFRKALEAVPGYSYARNNLALTDQNEMAINFNGGLAAFNRGDLKKAREFFLKAQRLRPGDAEVRQFLARIDDLQKFRPERAGMVYGVGGQVGWKVPNHFTEAERLAAWGWVSEQARIANRPFPLGVDLQRYSFGIGVAESTTEWYDLIDRVIVDQFTRVPTRQTGTSGYNAIKGRRFEQLDCHSNGAMLCLLALYRDDARAGDVVLYGPQLTANSAALWNRLLNEGKIRSLRIIVNENDPITPLTLLVSSSPTSWLRARALLFDRSTLRQTVAEMIPGASVTTRPCASDWPTLNCHRMTAYPTCKPRGGTPAAGTGGAGRRAYAEPPTPGC